MTTTIVSASNDKYFDLLRDLILSVIEKPESTTVSLSIFDVGLTQEQLKWLSRHVDHIVKPEWDFEFPGHETAPEYKKALTVRPFIPKYFPHFETYIWIDADAWVQDWKTIELLIEGSKFGKLAIVPEIDRNYKPTISNLKVKIYKYIPFFRGRIRKVKTWIGAQFIRYYGRGTANRFLFENLLNAGVFALERNAPHWKAWAESFRAEKVRNHKYLCDQTALNHAVYTRNLAATYLPSWCNWICLRAIPLWDERKKCLVEPSLPHHPIGIVHMVGESKFSQIDLFTTSGKRKTTYLRYSDFGNPSCQSSGTVNLTGWE